MASPPSVFGGLFDQGREGFGREIDSRYLASVYSTSSDGARNWADRLPRRDFARDANRFRLHFCLASIYNVRLPHRPDARHRHGNPDAVERSDHRRHGPRARAGRRHLAEGRGDRLVRPARQAGRLGRRHLAAGGRQGKRQGAVPRLGGLRGPEQPGPAVDQPEPADAGQVRAGPACSSTPGNRTLFGTREPADDLVAKREKKVAAEERKKFGPGAPKREKKSAADKQLAAQRDGLEVLDRLLVDLVAGGHWFEEGRVEKLERQAKSLGDAHLPAATHTLRKLLLLGQAKGDRRRGAAVPRRRPDCPALGHCPARARRTSRAACRQGETQADADALRRGRARPDRGRCPT